ncbi:MAG: MarC family protein [candidate division KSB1 bacterium]|nr:MarC family protein [candidate division KSB1 bacterium]
MASPIIDSVVLLFLLLNPFLIVIYIIELVQDSTTGEFWKIISRAGIISFLVFSVFSILGNRIFIELLQARFASFQVFGGIVFLIIGLRFVFNGPKAILTLRGEPEQVAGSLTMPIMIGPGSVQRFYFERSAFE